MGLLGNFLNWLATHLVVIAFAIFLTVGVLLWDPFHSSDPAVAQPASKPSVAEPSPPLQASSSGDADRRSLPDQAEALAVNEPLQVPPVISEPGSSGAKAPSQAPPHAGDSADEPPTFRPMREDAVALASSPANAVSTRFRNPELQPKVEKAQLPKLFAKRLAAARSAFSREDLDSAELHYLRYLSARPEDAVAFAELGNLYRAMGRTADALDAFYEAGLRFRDRGEWTEVQQLAIILETAGDPRGSDLLGGRR